MELQKEIELLRNMTMKMKDELKVRDDIIQRQEEEKNKMEKRIYELEYALNSFNNNSNNNSNINNSNKVC